MTGTIPIRWAHAISLGTAAVLASAIGCSSASDAPVKAPDVPLQSAEVRSAVAQNGGVLITVDGQPGNQVFQISATESGTEYWITVSHDDETVASYRGEAKDVKQGNYVDVPRLDGDLRTTAVALGNALMKYNRLVLGPAAKQDPLAAKTVSPDTSSANADLTFDVEYVIKFLAATTNELPKGLGERIPPRAGAAPPEPVANQALKSSNPNTTNQEITFPKASEIDAICDLYCSGACGGGCSLCYRTTARYNFDYYPEYDYAGNLVAYHYCGYFTQWNTCYTSACCQQHDGCYQNWWDVWCHADALLGGCAGCMLSGYVGCSDGGYWETQLCVNYQWGCDY